MQDQLAVYRLANLICPIVQVGSAVGTFKKHDDRNAFLAPPTARPLSGPRNRIQHDDTDGTYACKPQGLEIGLDDFEGDLGGTNQTSEQLAQLKIRTLTSQKATSYGKRVVDFAFANLTPVSNRGNWDNPDIDPIDQLDEQLDAIALDTGSTENKTLIMSTGEWRALRSNAKVKARLGLKDDLSLTREKLVAGLLYPVNLEISGVVYTSTKRGQSTVSKARMVAGYALIVHTQPVISQDDPSAFKCFSTNSVLLGNIMEYREEQSNSTIYKSDWSEDIEQTGAACARLLAITLPS
jgi:hypothetical protein